MAIGIGVINLYVTWKRFPHEINFILLEGAFKAANGEK